MSSLCNLTIDDSLSEQETITIGEKLAHFFLPGTVLAIKGPLGAGKTCLVKGIAKTLGIKQEITSPTFTIANEYEAILPSGVPVGGRLPFFHLDAYRLKGDDDFLALGGDEYFSENCITVVEWADIIKEALPKNTEYLEIKIDKNGKRKFVLGFWE